MMTGSIRQARKLCVGLGVFDLLLGGLATFTPTAYAALFHSNLADPPTDLIVRTGLLWLFFCAAELRAGLGAVDSRWLVIVASLRLMDVPADLAYAVLARGAAWYSHAMILMAPPFNLVMAAYLWRCTQRMKR